MDSSFVYLFDRWTGEYDRMELDVYNKFRADNKADFLAGRYSVYHE